MAKIERFPGKITVAEDDEEDAVFWHLKDDNGEVISQGEGHTSPENVQRAVNNVAREFTILYLKAQGCVSALRDVEAIPTESLMDVPLEDV